MAQAEDPDRKFSREFMDKFRDYRRKRFQQTLGDVATAVGAGAESFRTGQSAPKVFERWRTPQDKMSRQQKMAESQKIYDKMESSERFYMGEAQKHQHKLIDSLHKDLDRLERSVLEQRRIASRERNQRLDRELRAYQTQLRGYRQQITDLETPSKGVSETVEAVIPWEDRERQAHQRARQAAQEKGDIVFSGMSEEEKKKTGKTDAQIRKELANYAYDRTIEDEINEERKQAKAQARNTLENLIETGAQPKDVALAARNLAIRTGMGEDELANSLSGEHKVALRDNQDSVNSEIDDLKDNIVDIEGGVVSTTKQIPGGYEDRRQTIKGEMLKAARRGGTAATPKPEAVDTSSVPLEFRDFDTVYAEQQAAIKEGIGAPVEEEDEEDWFGLPGMRKPKGGAQSHFQGMLELIEKYPESSPAQYARQQILALKETEDYRKKHFGDTAVPDNMLLKEMARDWRAQNRKDRQEAKEKRSLKRQKEALAGLGPRPLRGKGLSAAIKVAGDASDDAQKRAATVVQGSTTPGTAV